MTDKKFKLLLLATCGFHLAMLVAQVMRELAGAEGLLYADGTPIGGDFINMWSSARMVLEGMSEAIYRPDAFMAFERTIIPAHIGLRLWAYPPHSLLLVPPLGGLGYVAALALWSALGLAVLAFGARRFGFDRIETAIIVLSPASAACLYYGQTGNFAAGLLLLALSARRGADPVSGIAAALLTIKPQAGFLLPLLWAVQRRWALIVLTGVLSVALIGASLVLFGPQAWSDYAGETLRMLDALERRGTGPFMWMIPSAFMSLRILLDNGDLAATLHMVFAAGVGAFVLWRFVANADTTARNALLLIGTVLITPYMHHYDLALLTSGALLVLRLARDKQAVAHVLVIAAVSLPAVIMVLNAVGAPISPLLILPLLWLAGRKPAAAEAGAPDPGAARALRGAEAGP